MRLLHRVIARTLLIGGVLLLPATMVPEAHIPPSRYAEDPRLTALRQFLAEKESPIEHLAEDFLIAADRYGLDWRLLPSVAFVESTAGKVYKNNNIFGWNNANTKFRSVRDGIYHVGQRLGDGELYRGKTLVEKLAVYNPYDHYAPTVLRVTDYLGQLEREARTRSATVFTSSATPGDHPAAHRN